MIRIMFWVIFLLFSSYTFWLLTKPEEPVLIIPKEEPHYEIVDIDPRLYSYDT